MYMYASLILRSICLYVNQKKIREIQISVEIKLYHMDNFKEDHIRNGLELRVFFLFKGLN